MTEPIDLATYRADAGEAAEAAEVERPLGSPSNAVYARVGDDVLLTAMSGVRHGVRPEEIMRDIREKHGVHLGLGELRLLLASRRVAEQPSCAE